MVNNGSEWVMKGARGKSRRARVGWGPASLGGCDDDRQQSLPSFSKLHPPDLPRALGFLGPSANRQQGKSSTAKPYRYHV